MEPGRQARIDRLSSSRFERLSAPRSPLFVDLYHFMLRTRWRLLLPLFAATYLALNLLFALLYFAGGDCIHNAEPGSFRDAFFFSVQTMSTIGYGGMTPANLYANMLVLVESFTNLLAVALVTGVIFAKFSRPTARVMFSNLAVIGEWEDGKRSFTFRMANERRNEIVEARLRVTLLRTTTLPSGQVIRRLIDLPLLRDDTPIFAMTWTAIHVIDEESPLFELTADDFRDERLEIFVSFAGLDGTFAQPVHARWSYDIESIRFGARFVDVITKPATGPIVMDFERFHDVEPLPETKGAIAEVA